MDTIVAGRFESREDADRAVEELKARGFNAQDASTFFVNPRGQHAQFPVGGDQYADAKSTGAGSGAVTGAAIGGAAGVAAAIAVPAVGAVVALGVILAGAYTGSLAGTLARLGKRDPVEHPEASPGRPSGMMVAAHVIDQNADNIATEVLRNAGAKDIERATGTWEDGDWKDFDPVEPPHVVDDRAGRRT